jgi:transcriptional regulator with XRE-family HTH domain
MRKSGLNSQKELADRLGFSAGTVKFWLHSDDKLPGFEALLAISKELATPLDDILGREPPGSGPAK